MEKLDMKTKQRSAEGRIIEYDLRGEMTHAVYVACLVRDLCRELTLPAEDIYDYTHAALLHDIGKLRLVNYLYRGERRENPMVVEEMKYVRMHSMLSHDILTGMGYPEKICEAVLYHHENYDGSGYPENLSGEEIPIGARIIRVCDVFAALTSDRPYRKHFSLEDALQLMIDEITNLDMKIFLAFNRVAHRVGTSYHRDMSYEELYTLICAFPNWEEVFCFGGHTHSVPEEILKKEKFG